MRVELDEILKNFPKRKKHSHKGTYGKILNVSGSKYYSGAAILSSLSALKTGAGYLTLACPQEIAPLIISYTPDLTLFPMKSNNGVLDVVELDNLLKKLASYDVVSIGSGLSSEPCVQNFVIEFLKKVNLPTVIDADGLNAAAALDFRQFPEKSVITPHPMEMSRLLKVDVSEIQSAREKYAKLASEKYNCVTVLKGMNTVVTDGNKVYVNNSGNSALSKAGTGDVLTGIISGLLAQGCDEFSAAAIGVYIHGLSADIAVKEVSEYSLLASELISYIPKAILKVI